MSRGRRSPPQPEVSEMHYWNGLQVLVMDVRGDYAVVLLPSGTRVTVALAEVSAVEEVTV